jgi:FkbM family methyltransferase
VVSLADGIYMEHTKKTYRTVVDVGANIGIFGHYMTKHCNAVTNRMICFEPYPKTYEVLCKNVPNGLNYQYAVGDVDCEEGISLGVYDDENLGQNRITTVYWEDGLNDPIGDTIDGVRQITLDSFLSEDIKDDIDLIKIDVEGYEIEVLKGAMGILETQKPDIFLELHNGISPCPHERFVDEIWPLLHDEYGYESVYDIPDILNSSLKSSLLSMENIVLSCDDYWKDNTLPWKPRAPGQVGPLVWSPAERKA